MAEMRLEDYMPDGKGRLVHIDNVRPVDKLRDELVKENAEKAMELQEKMREFKRNLINVVFKKARYQGRTLAKGYDCHIRQPSGGRVKEVLSYLSQDWAGRSERVHHT